VAEEHRRRGLAVAVLGELLGWGAERGATTAYLQTPVDNQGALALYDRVGFTVHHTYRYLRAPTRL
jgi:ribosomal protein S18 acetylase RimI-like enzyme